MNLPVDRKTRGRLALLFAVPLAFSLLFFLANQIAEHIDIRFLQLQNLASSLNRLLSLCKDAEIGERGFLLTGDDRYLAPLQQANAWLPGESRLCRTYAKDRPSFQQKIERVVTLAEKRLAEANQVLNTQRTKGFTAALELAKSGDALGIMDLVRNSVNELEAEINKQQSSSLDHERTLNRSAFIFFIVGTAVMIVVLVWLYNALLHFIEGRDAAQAELQTLNAELEARIDERTHELKQINEELQQFAYVASHDLQEPLRTITSFTQLLASRYRGKMDGDADEFIGFIVTSSRRMTDLINGLLALVRLRKAGQSTTPVAFEELLEEAEASLQAAIRESQTEIHHGRLPALIVDKVQFSQLLQNLISNAMKYRRDERPVIQVEAQREGSDWIFSIADNGQGFDQQYAERIFALFQRLHSRDVEGTGMGLSISRKIVERHGGRIWAESTPGVGSTFYFSLPVSLELPRHGPSIQPVRQVEQTR
ncbi:MAG: sensor histidine kinase [Bryobacteraceae bacterium]